MFLQGATTQDLVNELSGLDWGKILDGIVAATAILGSIVSLTKTLSERTHSRSGLISRRNHELEEAGKLAAFCTHVTQASLAPEHTQMLQQSIHSRLQDCIAAIKQLDLELTESAKDPNWQLTTWKRLCLWFRPTGWREGLLHLLAYIFFLAALWFGTVTLVQYGKEISHNRRGSQSTASTVVLNHATATPNQSASTFFSPHPVVTFILIIFTLIFRSACLDERRRELGYRRKLGRFSQLLLIQAPETGRMMAAQWLFYASTIVFLTVLVAVGSSFENFEDAVATGVFVLLPISLYVSIFHGWATAELYFWQQSRPRLRSAFYVMFKGLFQSVKQSGWAKLKLILAALLTPVVELVSLVLVAWADKLGDYLAGATGAFLVMMGLYAALRTVRIRYSLAEGKKLAAAAASAN